MIERTLVLLKPDAVERGISGEIIHRFERVGLKIVGMKMAWVDNKFAEKHYDEDLAKRRGANVRQWNVDFLSSGPVIAMAIEGVNAIENTRSLVGNTEPKSALPGTIRGDFSHVSYEYCDAKACVLKNTIHASADKKDAEKELKLWFKASELFDYQAVHEKHTR